MGVVCVCAGRVCVSFDLCVSERPFFLRASHSLSRFRRYQLHSMAATAPALPSGLGASLSGFEWSKVCVWWEWESAMRLGWRGEGAEKVVRGASPRDAPGRRAFFSRFLPPPHSSDLRPTLPTYTAPCHTSNHRPHPSPGPGRDAFLPLVRLARVARHGVPRPPRPRPLHRRPSLPRRPGPPVLRVDGRHCGGRRRKIPPTPSATLRRGRPPPRGRLGRRLAAAVAEEGGRVGGTVSGHAAPVW